jgi:hypothetical protein
MGLARRRDEAEIMKTKVALTMLSTVELTSILREMPMDNLSTPIEKKSKDDLVNTKPVTRG